MAVADFFLLLPGGEIDFVPAPRVNVDTWLRFWQGVTNEPERPGFAGVVRIMVEAVDAMLVASDNTLGELYDNVNAFSQRALDVVKSEVIGARARMSAMRIAIDSTSDPSALVAGVVSPMLHEGPHSLAAVVASIANQVEMAAPDVVHWNWSGILGGTVSLKPPDVWNIYAGSAKAIAYALSQLEVSAPGEAPTARDRVVAAGQAIGKALTGGSPWPWVIGGVALAWYLSR